MARNEAEAVALFDALEEAEPAEDALIDAAADAEADDEAEKRERQTSCGWSQLRPMHVDEAIPLVCIQPSRHWCSHVAPKPAPPTQLEPDTCLAPAPGLRSGQLLAASTAISATLRA